MWQKRTIFAFNMKTLYFFNPENDMALASGSPYYMPPASAKKMAEDLSALPAWFAEKESDVLLASQEQMEWMQKECPLSLDVNLVQAISPVYDKVVPWGWSPVVHRLFKQAGLSDVALLGKEEIERVRSLSSRRTAVDLLSRLRLPGTLGESKWLTSVDEVSELVKKYGKILLKAPWSGSGKGIQPLDDLPGEAMCGWIRRIVSTQGGVVGEPFYDKVVDFAMEFFASGESLSFVGYSMFDTDGRGIYKGNFLQSDEAIEGVLSSYVPGELLAAVRNCLLSELESLLQGNYIGYLGVDMMICRTMDGNHSLHPCVEVNLRMNMGLVSRIFFDRFVVSDAKGSFVVEYFPDDGSALDFHRRMKLEHPLTLRDGRICRGYLSLVPVFEKTNYQIYVLL